MEGYGVKHNLSYQQFADIIKIKSFHNLNFDKKIVKYISCEISFFFGYSNSKEISAEWLENVSLESIVWTKTKS